MNAPFRNSDPILTPALAGLAKALDMRGGAMELARRLNALGRKPVTASAIYQWKKVPDDRVLDVESVSGVPRHELRPDLYFSHPA